MKKLDLTGLQQGNLTFLHEIGRDKRNRILWLVECSCGRQFEARALNKHRGSVCRSCASSVPRPYLRTGYKGISGTQWGAIRSHARQRDISFEITIEEAWDRFVEQNERCALTGVEIVHAKYKNDPNKTASLDRIDSSKPYIRENIQWVHKTVNFMKHTLSDDELFSWCSRVVRRRESV